VKEINNYHAVLNYLCTLPTPYKLLSQSCGQKKMWFGHARLHKSVLIRSQMWCGSTITAFTSCFYTWETNMVKGICNYNIYICNFSLKFVMKLHKCTHIIKQSSNHELVKLHNYIII